MNQLVNAGYITDSALQTTRDITDGDIVVDDVY